MVSVFSLALLPLHDSHAVESDDVIMECSVYDDLSVKKSLEQNDPVVKTFLETYPDAKYFPGGVDESGPPKIDINYENKDSTKNVKLSVYVREVGPDGKSCFWPIHYTFQYMTINVLKNIVHYYSEKDSMINFIENFATPLPHQQLKRLHFGGIEITPDEIRRNKRRIRRETDNPFYVRVLARSPVHGRKDSRKRPLEAFHGLLLSPSKNIDTGCSPFLTSTCRILMIRCSAIKSTAFNWSLFASRAKVTSVIILFHPHHNR